MKLVRCYMCGFEAEADDEEDFPQCPECEIGEMEDI
jgi:hypothetical protein